MPLFLALLLSGASLITWLGSWWIFVALGAGIAGYRAAPTPGFAPGIMPVGVGFWTLNLLSGARGGVLAGLLVALGILGWQQAPRWGNAQLLVPLALLTLFSLGAGALLGYVCGAVGGITKGMIWQGQQSFWPALGTVGLGSLLGWILR